MNNPNCWKCTKIRMEQELGMPWFRCAKGKDMKAETCKEYIPETDEQVKNE